MAKERHLGIELLRVLSMGMIVLHHLLTWGGLLFAFPKLSATDTALRLLNAFANCAVNVYALITGYVGSRLRPARLLRQWLQVVFTGLAATLAASLFAPVDGSLFLKALLPVSLEEYWYFSAFFGLMLLTPLLNAALNGLSKRQMGLSLMGCVFLFSLMLPSNTVLRLNGGYHVGLAVRAVPAGRVAAPLRGPGGAQRLAKACVDVCPVRAAGLGLGDICFVAGTQRGQPAVPFGMAIGLFQPCHGAGRRMPASAFCAHASTGLRGPSGNLGGAPYLWRIPDS